MAINDLDTAIFRRVRTDTDLDRLSGIDNAIAHRAGHERAVIDALAIIEPRILMRVELNECQRTIFRGMGLEQRPCDEMIAAKR